MDPERQRQAEQRRRERRWDLFGPYLAERAWATVREDYSENGDVWRYFPHDHARSRAYRWNEDGLLGFSDDHQRLCFALALWNERDPILKERLFGVTGPQGNHGEDVKEVYFYLDNTPTHSYMRALYKYPHAAYPYERLLAENARRSRTEPEFELVDAGVFDEGRYFDVFVEYAKAGPTDILIQITAHNRGPEPAPLHLLPTLWFRNTWAWSGDPRVPSLTPVGRPDGLPAIVAEHGELGELWFVADAAGDLLFTDNETNAERLWGAENRTAHVKDAFHRHVVGREPGSSPPTAPSRRSTCARWSPPARAGRCACACPKDSLTAVPGRAGRGPRVRPVRRLRRGDAGPPGRGRHLLRRRPRAHDGRRAAGVPPGDRRPVVVEAVLPLHRPRLARRRPGPAAAAARAGERAQRRLEAPLQPPRHVDARHVGVPVVRRVGPGVPLPPAGAGRPGVRQGAARPADARVVPPPERGDAGVRVELQRREPPVFAWATWRVYKIEQRHGGHGDRAFLEAMFHKLLLHFTWWVNRKDSAGKNIFQGGFLGLDNIGVFDRSAGLPRGGVLEQSDATAWMGMFSLNMMTIALELARENPVYEKIASKFFEHFLSIADAMNNLGGEGIGLWDDQDEFFYDVLHLPDGRALRLRARSLVGLIPLLAVETVEPLLLEQMPGFRHRLEWFLAHRPDLARLVSRWYEPGAGERRLLALVRGSRMKRLLRRMLDPKEFLSDYGVRSLSKIHATEPYRLHIDGSTLSIGYEPGESRTGLFGGNSNWRGPVWFPINYLIIEALQKFHHYYSDDFRVECPTGSGDYMSIREIADELSRRLTRLFLPDARGRRPYAGDDPRQHDPHWREHLQFHEYFHGDTGQGLGASHQTGWTALVAKLLLQQCPAPDDDH
ncbi:MGH1-like glycoside hydrolase domain-containing protein [Nannocystis pusilla]|uniref:MGH1-like glycoside hydrolase domain-containing protein n=1 Tax=Nannocystis pusilla TaxID=889268 RepID=UPI003B7CE7C8